MISPSQRLAVEEPHVVRVKRFISSPTQLLAVILVGLALAANVSVFQFLFAPDGIITGDSRTAIWIAQAILLLTGAVAYSAHRPIEMRLRRFVTSQPQTTAVLVGVAGVAATLVAIEAGFHSYNTISARHRPPVIVRNLPNGPAK